MENWLHSFGSIFFSVVTLLTFGHKSNHVSVPTSPVVKAEITPIVTETLQTSQNIQITDTVTPTITITQNPQNTPTIHIHHVPDSVINGNGSISMYGETLNIHLTFPKNGGKVNGTLGNACTGDITGTYSGGDSGNLDAKANATCPVVFTAIQGTASFTGKADTLKGILVGNYSASAAGTMKSGSLKLTLLQWLIRGMIVKKQGGYYVVSEKTGKNLGGPYKTEEEAKNRMRQVEFFKHRKK